MDFISLFTRLLDEKTQTSQTTIKNYRADLHHFIKWFEKKKNTSYSPEKITQEVLDEYKATSKLAPSSVKRHIAALKKFHSLLSTHNFSHNPFSKPSSQNSKIDLEEFNHFLTHQKASPLTQRNYLSDLRTYLGWANKVTSNPTIKDILTPHFIEEYKLRLNSLHTPPATINRKLSSIRKLHEYAQTAGHIDTKAYQARSVTATPEASSLTLSELEKLNTHKTTYSKIPPIRFAQKLLKPYFELEDIIATKIAFKLKKTPKKYENRFKKSSQNLITQPHRLTIADATRHLYAPISAPKNATQLEKLVHHAQHTRPKWYKIYHSFTASHYLHFALLILGTLTAGFLLYQTSIADLFSKGSILGVSTPPKILAFQGSLSNEQDIPITDPTTVYFSIYSEEFNGTPLWQESQLASPDNSGTFTAYLGSKIPLDTQIFAQNSQLYLGIRIEGQEELTPRQRLANVAYASNSEYLQGLSPITQEGAGSKNVVLALDSSGNLTIPGGGTHTFTAQGGGLTLSGQTVVLSTNTASNGNVVLAPDGTGKIDIQNSIINSSQNGALFPGSVTIQDETVVTASSSGKAAFTILKEGTGNVLTASSGGQTRFVITESGYVGINTQNPTEILQVKGDTWMEGDGRRIYGSNLKIHSSSGSNLLIQPSAQSTGNIGIGTTSPTAFVDIDGGNNTTPLLKLNYKGSGANIIDAQKSDSTLFVLNDSGNVGLGTSAPSSKIHLSSSTSSSGGIRMGDTNLYRSATDTITTDDSFSIAGDLTVDGTTTLNNVRYTWPGSDGSSGQVLTTNGSGQLTWTSKSNGTSFWQQNNGALSPLNLTDDILAGSTSTASALVRLPGLANENAFINTGGNVGIGTTSPNQDFEVNGDIRLDLNEAATTNGVCHSGANSDTTASDRDLVVCSSAPADIAEWYAADTSVEAGHIVEISSQTFTYTSQGADAETGIVHNLKQQEIGILTRANNISKVLGVISTAPFQTIGSDIKKELEDSPDYKAVPLALAGRVLLKIAYDSPQIKAGDPITLASSASGKGTKATSPSFIVARALENWDHDKEEILVYVQPTWYQPITVNPNGSTGEYQNISQNNTSPSEIVTSIIQGADIFAQRIHTGSLIAKELTIQNTLAASKIITERLKAGSIEAGKITTDTLAITSDRLTVGGKTLQQYVDERIAQVQNTQLTNNLPENNTSQVASEPNIKNIASVSGELTAGSLSTQGDINAKNASISGTLNTDMLVAKQIEGLEEKIASLSSKQASTSGIAGQKQNLSANPTSNSENKETYTYSDVQTDQNGLAILPSHKSTFAIFEQDLSVYGTSTLTQATVLDSLSVGSGNTELTIGSNSFNSIERLEIQPLAQAAISFQGGKVVLDTQGNMTIGGNTLVSGTLAAHDAIFENGLLTTQVTTGIISPLPENDLAIRLGEKEDGRSQKLEVQTSSGAAILSVDNQGNLQASGSGTFAKLNFWEPPVAHAEISELEVETQGVAGKASIKEGRRELTINNPNVTEKSLIYITPASNSQNKVVYLLRQQPGESFTVGITTQATEDIEFNWLIVN